MHPDLALVLGITLAAFSIPSMVSAFADRRTPRVSALVVILAGVLILWAMNTQPNGYQWRDIPETFVRVIARFLN